MRTGQNPPVPVTGMIDLHSHLLPGIDDGAGSLDESLDCARTLLEHGFAGTVCTPHMAVSTFPDITPARLTEKVAALQEQLRRARLDYQLWAGGELRIAPNTIAWLAEHGVPTLGPSRNVLVDYWGTQWPAYADLTIERLLELGYQPILAHPERMDFEDREWDAVLSRLEQIGVWLQGNLKCLAGWEGPRVGQRGLCLLRENRYRVLATDIHGTQDLAERLQGIHVVEREVGAAVLQRLLRDGPEVLVARMPALGTP